MKGKRTKADTIRIAIDKVITVNYDENTVKCRILNCFN